MGSVKEKEVREKDWRRCLMCKAARCCFNPINSLRGEKCSDCSFDHMKQIEHLVCLVCKSI
jgi:hypothetical protein